MARRSINDAAKVFLAAFVLGPPIGGIAFMALLQVVPWFATGFAARAPEAGNLLQSLPLMVPLSYLVGGMAAGLAGLASPPTSRGAAASPCGRVSSRR